MPLQKTSELQISGLQWKYAKLERKFQELKKNIWKLKVYQF